MLDEIDTGGATLRAEAQPATWNNLFDEQRDAVRRLLEFLRHAVRLVDAGRATNSDDHRDDWMIYEAPNTTVLLDGDRGTGKTTALFSAVAAVRRGTLGADVQDDAEQVTDEVRAVSKLLADLRERIVFLEPLDLEPFPTSVNLLSAILARLDDATRGWRELEPPSSYTGVLDPSRLRSGQADLAALQRDVALAWDGNLEQRKGTLDPDNFAAETKAVERARLSLNRRFSNLLDELAEASPRSGLFQPVFVLPVDDFDLNPKMTVELARLLRMLKTPRLVILILGSFELIEQVYRFNLEREFTEIAGDAGRDRTTNIPEIADRLVKHQLRKSLPPEQRIVLRSVSGVQLLAFTPLGTADRSIQLHRLLDAVDWPDGGGDGKQASVLDFLAPPPLMRQRPEAPDADSRPLRLDERVHDFVGLELLSMTPRALSDFQAELQARQSASWFRDFIGRRLREEVLDLSRTGGTSAADIAESIDGLLSEAHVGVSGHAGVVDVGDRSRRDDGNLPPTLRLGDLRFDATVDSRAYGLSDSRLIAAGCEWFGRSPEVTGSFAWTAHESIDLPWPTPDVRSSWALARLLDAIRRTPSATDLDQAIARWIYLGTLAQQHPARLAPIEVDTLSFGESAAHWQLIAETLDAYREHERANDEWVFGCVAMVTPEMGASLAARDAFIDSLERKPRVADIRGPRIAQLRKLYGSLAGDESARIDRLRRLGIDLPTTAKSFDPALSDVTQSDQAASKAK